MTTYNDALLYRSCRGPVKHPSAVVPGKQMALMSHFSYLVLLLHHCLLEVDVHQIVDNFASFLNFQLKCDKKEMMG